ncbi:MAG: hypothetical protein MK008_02980 [Bdellovibrionales bacterium]|nr:hypothetical protein [Bdellovibrionales bacterium]
MLRLFPLILLLIGHMTFAQQTEVAPVEEVVEEQSAEEANTSTKAEELSSSETSSDDSEQGLESQVNAESVNSPKATVMEPAFEELPVKADKRVRKTANPDILTPPASSERGGFQVGEYGLFQKDMEKFNFTYSGENLTIGKDYNENGLSSVVTEHITGFEFAYSDDVTTYFAQSYHTSFDEDVDNELGDFRMGLKKNFGIVFSDVEFEWHSRLYLPFKEEHRKIGKIQWRNYLTFTKPIMQSNWNFLYELETRFWFYTEDELGQEASSFANKVGVNYKGFSFIDPILYALIKNKFYHTGTKFNAGTDELNWEDPLDFKDTLELGFEAYIPITDFLGVIPIAEYEFSYSSNQGKSFEPFAPESTLYLLIISLKI